MVVVVITIVVIGSIGAIAIAVVLSASIKVAAATGANGGKTSDAAPNPAALKYSPPVMQITVTFPPK